MIFEITCKCCGLTFSNVNRKRSICQPCRVKVDPTNLMSVFPDDAKPTMPMSVLRGAYGSAWSKAFRRGIPVEEARAIGRQAYAEAKRKFTKTA